MDAATPGYLIDSREHLVGLLAEAAEIEHNLMCCYLYAAFSLKESADEGLSEGELAAVRRWRRSVLSIGIDEMAHLALVANLSSALGGVPHFGRLNFPIGPGAHPAGIVVKLAPFNYETLSHFVYLERPEGAPIQDGLGFEPLRRYERVALPGRLMPSSYDYETVGGFYRTIRQGLQHLVERLGERAVFIGNPDHQLGSDVAQLPGLTRVRCLKTALEALDGIVVQGEGAPGHSEDSHYQRFLTIRDEFDQLRAARPEFVPGRPAAHNPVMRRPPTPEDKVWIDLRPAADLLDLANAAYTHMLRLMVQGYAETRGVREQRAMVEAAIDLMRAITPVASALTRLPASAAHPQCTAGMSFATIRGLSALPAGPSADYVLLERFDEIAALASRLKSDIPHGVPEQLARISQRLRLELHAKGDIVSEEKVAHQIMATTPLAAAATTPSPPLSTVVDGVEVVEGRELTLHYDGKRCIHARHCVLGQPKVFKANVKGPWLDPDAASTEAMVTVAHLCPSGAIAYVRKDGGPNEAVPAVNLVQLRENGPLGLRGDLRVNGQSIGYRATLCRCGASQRKPFCDGSHNTVSFRASGEPETRSSEPLAVRDGPVEVEPQPNGPLVVRGNVEICAGTGRTVDRVTSVRLCRCGGSTNKPFCDGTHARNGFSAD